MQGSNDVLHRSLPLRCITTKTKIVKKTIVSSDKERKVLDYHMCGVFDEKLIVQCFQLISLKAMEVCSFPIFGTLLFLIILLKVLNITFTSIMKLMHILHLSESYFFITILFSHYEYHSPSLH